MCAHVYIVVNDGSVENMRRESIDFHLQISRPFSLKIECKKNIIHEAFHLNGKLEEHQS